MSSELYVVVPAYNEAPVVGAVINGLRALFPRVILVNDGSTDDTARAAADAGATVLTHPLNLGQGAALQTGIEYARRLGARYVATFDADGQHDPRDLPKLLRALQDTNADLALGSRFLGHAHGISWRRRALLRSAVIFHGLLYGLWLSDAHNGLRVLGPRALQTLELRQNGMAHATEILGWMKRYRLRFVEIPVRVRYTAYSRAKGQRGLQALKILSELLLEKIGGTER